MKPHYWTWNKKQTEAICLFCGLHVILGTLKNSFASIVIPGCNPGTDDEAPGIGDS